MSVRTKIQWCDHTWSPWFGCTKVSPGCAHCYAEVDNGRYKRNGGGWGEGAPRVRSKGWRVPVALNRSAQRRGVRERVFPSLCDPWDREVPHQWRIEFFDLIGHTPWLDWLLLTKRPEFINGQSIALPNAHYGVSVENQTWADIRREPFRNAICGGFKFVSYEPALGPIDWTGWEFVQQIIYGGESGSKSRPADVDWARRTLAYCRVHGIAPFIKQLGAMPVPDISDYGVNPHPLSSHWPDSVTIAGDRIFLNDKKGGDPNEWPHDLRIREFPPIKGE